MLDRVHANGVDAGLLDPVQDILYEVVGHLRQVVVQVGQAGQFSLDLVARPVDNERAFLRDALRSVSNPVCLDVYYCNLTAISFGW